MDRRLEDLSAPQQQQARESVQRYEIPSAQRAMPWECDWGQTLDLLWENRQESTLDQWEIPSAEKQLVLVGRHKMERIVLPQ